MDFFIDTANLDEVREAQALGILDGVTTNPSLIKKAGLPYIDTIRAICEIVDGPVSAEVLATDEAHILEEARFLARIAENVVVKVPLIPDGLKAVKKLTAEGIRTNVTLCFSTPQALLAAKAGATYVSPFIGRLDDRGQDGMELISEIVAVFRNYAFGTKVLVASIRHPVHVVQSAMIGADAATIPFGTFTKLVGHPLTDLGLKAFLADAEGVRILG